MKKVLIIALLVTFIGCKKNNDSKTNQSQNGKTFNFADLIVGGEEDPEGFIVAYSLLGGSGVKNYSFSAYFKNHPDSPANYSVGSMLCNGKTIPLVNIENNTYKLDENSGANDAFTNWFGNTITTSYAGGGTYSSATFSLNKYKEFDYFTLSGVSGKNNIYNKSAMGGVMINWNADSTNTDSVYLEITYDYELSKIYNAGTSTTPVSKVIRINDNGSYTIPSSFFSPFHSNSYNRIALYRGSYDDFNSGTVGNSRVVGILGYSSAANILNIQ